MICNGVRLPRRLPPWALKENLLGGAGGFAVSSMSSSWGCSGSLLNLLCWSKVGFVCLDVRFTEAADGFFSDFEAGRSLLSGIGARDIAPGGAVPMGAGLLSPDKPEGGFGSPIAPLGGGGKAAFSASGSAFLSTHFPSFSSKTI